jgi:Fe2+ transport protein
MSNTPNGPGGAAAGGGRVTRRSALLAGAITVAVLAVVALAHAVHGSAKAAPMTTTTASSTSSMSMSTTTKAAAPAMDAVANGTVPVIKGGSLPVMPISGALPTAMAMVPLGAADWEGMSIQAQTSAPASFELFNGTSQQLVKPTSKTSFHLMVLLSDKSTGMAIPYSSVWATVKKGGEIVFDERLWPMISRYMGPHYGNNVSLPNAGVYHLTLLVSPPAAARHLEYKGLWLQPHRVNLTFRWEPKT